VNGLLGKFLNLASEKVILELVRTKCTPILLYELECFQLGKAGLHSLDFTFNRLCMKLFKTGSIDVGKDCQSYFAMEWRDNDGAETATVWQLSRSLRRATSND